MKKHNLFFTLLYFAILYSHSSYGTQCIEVFHRPKILTFHIQKLRPTQMEYGQALVDLRAKKLIEEAKASETELHFFISERNFQFIVPVVISPKNEVFVTDSHHGIAAAYKALGKNADILFQTEVQKDYRKNRPDGSHWSYRDFIEHLLTSKKEGGLGKGHFPKAISSQSPIELFEQLPKNFNQLIDNPMRSLVGEALKEFGVKRSFMEDYIDFKIGNLVLEEGYSLGEGSAFTHKNIQEVANIIFSSKKILDFMLESSRSKKTEFQNRKLILNAQKKWQSLEKI